MSSSKRKNAILVSDNSKNDADPKKGRDGTSSSSYSDPDIFEEGLHPFNV